MKAYKIISSFFMAVSLFALQHLSADELKFSASLDGLQVHPLDGGPSGSTATGKAFLVLDTTTNTLQYELQFDGLDIVTDSSDRNDPNDITAIHFHIGPTGGKGPHALNIFGFGHHAHIRHDDADMTFDSDNESILGIWDDSDLTYTGEGGTKEPFDSDSLTNQLANLLEENLYIQVHTNANPTGDIRGQVIPVEEDNEEEGGLFLNLTTDDIWRGSMALNFANRNLEAGYPVTIFLNITGVRIAVKERRIPQHVNGITEKTLQELLMDAVDGGATVIVCPFCLKQAGFKPRNLVMLGDGVELGGHEVTIPSMYGSEKVLSY